MFQGNVGGAALVLSIVGIFKPYLPLVLSLINRRQINKRVANKVNQLTRLTDLIYVGVHTPSHVVSAL